MEVSRRTFLAFSAALLRESMRSKPFVSEVSRGTPTLYGTDDSLMNYNVLYRCGLSGAIEYDSEARKVFLGGTVNDWYQHGLIENERYFQTLIPRLPEGHRFPQRLYSESRPVLIAPDPRHFTGKYRQIRRAQELIGREVILRPDYYYDQSGQQTHAEREMPAYIFDVLAEASRPYSPHHFNDLDPSSFQTLLGITTNEGPPWFQVGQQVLHAIPQVTMYFDRRQLMSPERREIINSLLEEI